MISVCSSSGASLFSTNVNALVNPVNCVGVMGAGLALAFREHYPQASRAYQVYCRQAPGLRPGQVFSVETGGFSPRGVVHFPTKDHWTQGSRMDFIESGLVALVQEVRQLGIRSVAIPALGCGLGGLAWAEVRPRIEDAFAPLTDVETILFPPR